MIRIIIIRYYCCGQDKVHNNNIKIILYTYNLLVIYSCTVNVKVESNIFVVANADLAMFLLPLKYLQRAFCGKFSTNYFQMCSITLNSIFAP